MDAGVKFAYESAQEAQTLEEVRMIVGGQLGYYNHERRHSALDYRVPYEVVSETILGEDSRC